MKLTNRFVPAAQKESPWLMLVIHGLGDSMDGYSWLPKELNLPWMNFVFVNGPEAYYAGYSWFDFYSDPVPGIQQSRTLLLDLLEDYRNKGFQPGNIFIFGFSQGCLMTIEVGIQFPHLLAGCIGISGLVHEPEKMAQRFSSVARQQKFLITHGSQDPLLPLAGARGYVQKLKEAGLQIDYVEFVKAHTIAGAAEMHLIREFIKRAAGKNA